MGQNPDAGWSPKISYNRWLMDVSSLTNIYKYDCHIVNGILKYGNGILKYPKIEKNDVSSQIKHPTYPVISYKNGYIHIFYNNIL